MAKRKLVIASLISLVAVSLIGATASTLAWLTKSSFLDFSDLNGASEGAYFAYGKGTSDDPYGISSPRHLYNLSWLNMRGYFEGKDNDGDGVIGDTFYFEIDPNIEGGVLSGLNDDQPPKPMVIPPIGTKEHPFYGNFNGNGKIISDFVISASLSDYRQKPYNTSEFFVTPEIVGLFGVIGALPDSNYTYDTSANELFNVGIQNLTIKTATQESLIGIVAGYVNGKIGNVAVNASSVDINASTSSALSENFTDNLSDYGIIGHCTKNYSEVPVNQQSTAYYDKKDISKNVAQVYEVKTSDYKEFNAHERGENAGGGDSIDLKDMYTTLHANWQVLIDNPSTYKTKYVTGTVETNIDLQGKPTIVSEGTQSNAYNNFNKANTSCYNSQADGRHSYYNYSLKDGAGNNAHQTASYNYIIEPYSPYSQIGNSGLTEEDYMCLGGKAERSLPGQSFTYTNVTNTLTETTGRYIQYRSGNTTNYLTRGANNLNVTSSASASLWTYQDNQFITFYDSHNYYLNCDSSGNLTVTTSSDTIWRYDSANTAYYATVSGKSFFLGFNGTKWTTTECGFYTLIHSGNNYMSHPNTTGYVKSTTSTTGTEVRWYLTSDGYFKTTETGTTYYLRIYDSNDHLYYSNSTNYRLVRNGDGLYYKGNYEWWCYYTGNSTYPWDAEKAEHTLSFDQVFNFSDTIHSSQITLTQSEDSMTYYVKASEVLESKLKTNATYFPLKGTLSNGQLSVEDSNTGYVLSGSYFTTDPYGDIRVSSFNIGDLSGSYDSTNKKFTKIYTYHGGSTQEVNLTTGQVGTTSKTFERFTNASSQLLGTLKDDNTANKIYGLHFMDASISTSHTVKVPYAKVADKDPKDLVGNENPFSTYTDYEMPEDSIDFHFKENGIINFFAGTYYEDSTVGSNNTFFSLHQIERYKTGDTIPQGKAINDIKSIKQISNIYENTDGNTKGTTPYVYQYSDNSYSAVGTAGTTALFNTSWITNPTISNMDSAYYFEIPANKGEYALGSVSGKAGAYLMYLDLGANANKVGRTRISEHFVETEDIYDYPLGVAFVNSFTRTNTVIDDKTVSLLDVDPINSVNFVVEPGYTGTIAANRSSATAMTATLSNTSAKPKVKAGYYKETISFTDGSSGFTEKPRETVTKETKRIEIFDYSINSLYLTRTVVEEVETRHAYGGVVNAQETTTSRTMKQYVYNSNGTLNTSKTITDPNQESNIKVYNPDDPTVPGQPYSDPKNQLYALLDIYSDDNHIIYKMSYTTPDGVTATIAFDLTYALRVVNDEYRYQATGYDYTITVTGSSVVVTVITASNSYTFKINTTTVTTGSTKTVDPAS